MFEDVIRHDILQSRVSRHRLDAPLATPRVHYISALARRWLVWRERRRAQAELMALPDYLLRDIGISRSQIGHAMGYKSEP